MLKGHQPSFLKSILIESILDNLDNNRNEYPIEVTNFCYCTYSICPHNYLLFWEVLDLPYQSTLKNYFSQKIDSIKENLIDLSKVSMIIENYRESYNIIEPFDAINGVYTTFQNCSKDSIFL